MNFALFPLKVLLFFLFTGLQLSAQSVQITGSSFPSLPATSCTNTYIDINVQLSQSNIAHINNSVSVSGFTVTVDLHYSSSGFGIPVISNTIENVNLGMLPPGSYTVVMNANLNRTRNSTANTSLSVASCCPAIPSFTVSADMICTGDSIYFNNTSTGAISQSWYENGSLVDTTQDYGHRYNSPGTYTIKLVVSDGSCQDSAVKTVLVSNPPVPDLGLDTAFCPGGDILLDAGGGYDSIRWSDMSASRMLLVDSPGTYYVKVYKNTCEGSDTISVGIFPSVQVDLGKDTLLCYGDSLVLNAFVPGASYFWQDSSNQSSLTLWSAGLYTVEVTDSNGCTWHDSVNVSMDSCDTRLPDNSINASISVYPNPAKNHVHILGTSETEELCSVEIYDVTGALIMRKKLSLTGGVPAVLGISELTPGVYTLRLEAPGFSVVYPLMKH